MYDTVLELINTNKSDASSITAAEDREVDIALLNYIKTLAPLAKGVLNIGDSNGNDTIHTVNFSNLGTSDYSVFGTLQSKSSNYDLDNDVMWVWREPTPTSFKVAIREVNGVVQNLSFHWEIKLK